MVVDYGRLDLPAALPTPSPVLFVNGLTTATTIPLARQVVPGGLTYFVGTFLAPNVISSDVKVIIPGLDITTAESFATIDPPIAFSVLARTIDGCFVPIGNSPAPDPDLAMPGLCDPRTTHPSVIDGGLDDVELIADYRVLDSTGAPPAPPTATFVVDGLQSGGPLTAFTRADAAEHVVFTTRSHPPVQPSNNAVVALKTAADTAALAQVAFALGTPRPVLTVTECPGAACSVVGGVGTIRLSVGLPGDVAEPVTLASTLDDGTTPPAVPGLTTSGVLGNNVATVEVTVPTARNGATWTIVASYAGMSSTPFTIQVAAPPIVAELSCGSPCSIATGASVGLTITAPKAIHDPTAIVSATLDGTPVLVAMPVALAPDNTNSHVTQMIALIAPGPGSWTITVSVDGYQTSASATVH